MKFGTNSSDRSHRKIEIKRRSRGGTKRKSNNDRILTIKKFYEIKITTEGRKLLSPENGN